MYLLVNTERRLSTKSRQKPVPDMVRSAMVELDPLVVERIQRQCSDEWAFWRLVVNNFNDANYHQAYISFCAHKILLGKASDRYLKHSQAMLHVDDCKWQVELSEQMLDRVKSILIVQNEMSLKSNFRFSSSQLGVGHVWQLIAFLVGGIFVTYMTLN